MTKTLVPAVEVGKQAVCIACNHHFILTEDMQCVFCGEKNFACDGYLDGYLLTSPAPAKAPDATPAGGGGPTDQIPFGD